jgi:probable addiction module antidote protein
VQPSAILGIVNQLVFITGRVTGCISFGRGDRLSAADRWRQDLAAAGYQTDKRTGEGIEGDRKMTVTYATFDISDYLDNDEVIAEYLTVASQDANPDVLLAALSHVAKAKGMTQVAKDAGLGRESLYKALSPGAHPRFETINAVMLALNVRLAVVAG